ncbi:MAG: PhoX family protein, partial [Burkholderiales bacterium]
DQALQMGMHHDGLHYVPLDGSTRGLLVMNHEYVDDGLLHPDGMKTWSASKVRKAQAAHGVSVVEVARGADGRWAPVRPSPYARRFTAYSPFAVSGPAAGHPLMRTAADPDGRTVLGTLNNCASGMTPWGTYLSGEENFAFYFAGGEQRTADQRRWGLAARARERWAEHDERFDATKHPNEFHRFGWVVEIDPLDPASTPVKRTALGRAAHEGASVATTRDGRAVVYSGEDARFEYLYKFVSRDRIAPGGAKANRELLDHGTLYVARFDADGTGRWLPLVAGQGPLTAAAGFPDQGAVVIRWTEDGDFDGTTFRWGHLVLAGDPANARTEARGDVRGDIFGCPDGLLFDARGVLWIQTDASATQMYQGEFRNIGNNQMLACDLRTGVIRRFLTGPVNCEVTGASLTPDFRTLFVNIQHPGETPSERSDPDAPTRFSRWPDGGTRPRSATVVIRRADGAPIGT